MNVCSIEKLLQLIENKLDAGQVMDVFEHLDRCGICRDTIYHIAHDRYTAARVLLPQKKKNASRNLLMTGPARRVIRRYPSAGQELSELPATGTLGY